MRRFMTAVVLVVAAWPGPALLAQAPAQAPKPAQGGAAQHADHDAKHVDHMEHSFADVERYAKSFDNPARDAWQMPDRVIATLGLKAGESVADVGAGTGYFTVRLAKSATAPKVFASDIEPKMVKHLQHRATAEGLKNVTAVLARTDSPNLPEPVDVILIVDTYHHIPNRVGVLHRAQGLAQTRGPARDHRLQEGRARRPARAVPVHT